MDFQLFKIETFIPEEYLDELRERLNKAGALSLGGNYDSCVVLSKVTGCWRPLEGSNPFIGEIGKLTMEEEIKMEFNCRAETLKETLKIIKEVHPYEEPVINVLPQLDLMRW